MSFPVFLLLGEVGSDDAILLVSPLIQLNLNFKGHGVVINCGFAATGTKNDECEIILNSYILKKK